MPRIQNIDWYSAVEAAAYLGISAQSVRQYILQSRFPHARRAGKCWQLPLQDVECFAQQRERKSGKVAPRITPKT